MRKIFGCIFLAIFTVAPAGAQMMGAQSMMGMGPLQYYVGTWSCVAGNVGSAPVKATATFTLDAGILRQWVFIPRQGKMKGTLALALVTSYDAQKHRYVQTNTGSDGGWSASYAKPWSGNTELWIDQANDSGKLGHSVTVRNSQSRFSFMGYPTIASMKADFKGSCTRSS